MRETHARGKDAVAGTPTTHELPPNRPVGGLPAINVTSKQRPRRIRRGG